jgi:hypothetical protein
MVVVKVCSCACEGQGMVMIGCFATVGIQVWQHKPRSDFYFHSQQQACKAAIATALGGQASGQPSETLLVLDGTTGVLVCVSCNALTVHAKQKTSAKMSFVMGNRPCM